jgi:hypothetical protein
VWYHSGNKREGMNMISKELLSEVLGSATKGLKSFGLSECGIYLIFQYEDFDDSISVYELAHKCKEWAYNLKQEIIIKSYTVFNAGGCELIDKMGCSVYICDAKTEPEAIFKACEWIMEQKQND